MIQIKRLICENIVDAINSKYPVAGDIVDGREVNPRVDNMASIGASFNDYQILPKIREVPISDFHANGKHYSVNGTNAIKRLAEKISESNIISPLIVAIDKEGPYILEGATRIEALYLLGAKSFPALVVIDLDNI